MNMVLSEFTAHINCILLIICLILIVMNMNSIIKMCKKQQENENTGSFKNNFVIDIPKEKSVEDAPPLFVVSNDKQRYVIGVFDGMGGSGSTLYEENNEIHTGAYLASREAKKAVEQFFRDRFDEDNFSFIQNDIELLKKKIIEKLKKKLSKQQYGKSNIKSNLVRTFPTTMAVGLISFLSKKAKIKVLWAGDSRIYCLSTKKGLIQLTKDDLKVDNDPFQNIKNDSPLSNMVNLSNDFSLNFKEIEENMPAVFLAATDGCFQFFPTPMHFENMLLQTLQNAKSIEEWKNKISDVLKNISGDDCSISLLCLADNKIDFISFKKLFKTRNETLYCDFMKDIEEQEKVIANLKERQNQIEYIEQLEIKRNKLYENLWLKYKETSYSLFNIKDICEQVK